MTADTSIFPKPRHNHGHCMRHALDKAETVCKEKGVRLTENRRAVLEIVWMSHCPVTAYEILEQFHRKGKKVQAPMVYRCLEFLLQYDLVHRVESMNAYVGCQHPSKPHAAELLICRSCGVAAEVVNEPLERNLRQFARKHGFTLQDRVVELAGLCDHCRESG